MNPDADPGRRRARLEAPPGPPLADTDIGSHLRSEQARFPDRPALIWSTDDSAGNLEVLTHAELGRAVDAAARDLARLAGPGDRVAIWARNSPEWVILECASALAGTVLAPFNTAWTDDEVSHAIALTSPRVLYAGADNRGTDLRERARTHAARAADLTMVDIAEVSTHPPADTPSFDAPDVAADAPFLIQFTSGTTGRAKGATLSHHAALNSAFVRVNTVDADEHDVWLNPIPLHHVGGSVIIVLAALATGACYVVMSRFDPAVQVPLMRETGASRTGGVPTMFYALLDQPGGREVLAQVRSLGLGGASVPPSLVEELQRGGSKVSVAYAQSECPMITQSDPDGDADHIATTVGVAVPHTEIRIVDGSGDVVGRNEIGEIVVRSPLTMTGYWNSPEATADAFDAEGFLRTGDLASIDDEGVVRIHGRARELIIRGGENIYPAEVEDALLRDPAVAAAAVISLPSERWGEEVAAVVSLQPDHDATPDDLMAHASRLVAHFKVPRHWRIVWEFPMTASGKIRKVELPALFDET
jgi:acyl-CoA synthetase (AMP-forming)/AMP-acid ligase II